MATYPSYKTRPSNTTREKQLIALTSYITGTDPPAAPAWNVPPIIIGGSMTIGGSLDQAAMTASQTFSMSTSPQTLNWVGPANPSQPWINSSTGVVSPGGVYYWRFRFWTATAPGASNLRVLISNNSGYARVFNVDDLTAATAYRVGYEYIQPWGPAESPIAPTISINFPTTDPTGVLRYDMLVTRLVY